MVLLDRACCVPAPATLVASPSPRRSRHRVGADTARRAAPCAAPAPLPLPGAAEPASNFHRKSQKVRRSRWGSACIPPATAAWRRPSTTPIGSRPPPASSWSSRRRPWTPFPSTSFPPPPWMRSAPCKGATFTGSLRVSGGGDPEYLRPFLPGRPEPPVSLRRQPQAPGHGHLAGRGGGRPTPSSSGPHRPDVWRQHHFNTWYGAEISALSYNDNCFTLTVLPGAKPGAPALAAVKPDVGYVRIVNRARRWPAQSAASCPCRTRTPPSSP